MDRPQEFVLARQDVYERLDVEIIDRTVAVDVRVRSVATWVFDCVGLRVAERGNERVDVEIVHATVAIQVTGCGRRNGSGEAHVIGGMRLEQP